LASSDTNSTFSFCIKERVCTLETTAWSCKTTKNRRLLKRFKIYKSWNDFFRNFKKISKEISQPLPPKHCFRSFTHKLNTLPFLCDSYPLFSLPSDGGQNYADLRPASLTIT